MVKKFVKCNWWKVVVAIVLTILPSVMVYCNKGNLQELFALEVTDTSGCYTLVGDVISSYTCYMCLFQFLLFYITYLVKKSILNKNVKDRIYNINTLKIRCNSLILWIVPIVSVLFNVGFYIVYKV